MYQDMRFEIKQNHDVQALYTALKEHYSVKKERKAQKESTFYDTFDWRLYTKSFMLVHSGERLSLLDIENGSSVACIASSSVPNFAWDLPDSTLRKQLEQILEMRALLQVFEIQTTTTPLRILNEDEKTVAHLFHEEASILLQNHNSLVFYDFLLKGVRGYDVEARKIAEIIQAAGLVPSKESFYKKALAAAGKHAGDYSAKLNLILQPEMRADEATKSIMRFLLAVMKQNEDGIRRDIDTEFLHDFRVAIRRTRSALSQIKTVFPEETTERFKNDFSYLGKSTNQLRDLDVYLLNADEYKKMLPVRLRAEIDPLFDNLKKERATVLQSVIAVLDSQEYARILHDWQAFLNQPPSPTSTTPNAAVPVITVAQKRIYKKYHLIVRAGSEISVASEDRLLHRLRIECKKLRYLLEFFSSLFEQEKIIFLVKQLKKLQDNLGRFQDLCVQEEELQKFIDNISFKNPRARKTIAAIGSLIGTMDREKRLVRAHFAEIFSEFASNDSQKLFQVLFKSKGERGIS